MTDVYYEVTACRLCGSRELKTVAVLPDSPAGDDFVDREHLNKPQPNVPVELMLCKCGQVQLRHVLNPDLIYTDYTYVSSNSLGLVQHFHRYAAHVMEKIQLPSNALIVEFGSNAGDLLRAFQARGHRVLGIDPAKAISQYATESGIPTISEYFTFERARQIRQQYGPASIVLANNVMANIPDLVDVVEGVRHLLTNDGVFIFETSYLMDVMQYTLIDCIFHEHLSVFSISPLVEFFRQHGLDIFDVEHVATKGGSIRVFVQLKHGPHPMARVYDFLKAERFGAAQGQGWLDWNCRLIDTRQRLMLILEQLKHDGKKVAAYGASDGCTEMIYAFNLAPYLDCILDDNPGKIGKYSPGHRIPVKSSAELSYPNAPNAVVILAWRYTDAIRARNPGYGGQWIGVMPEVRVL